MSVNDKRELGIKQNVCPANKEQHERIGNIEDYIVIRNATLRNMRVCYTKLYVETLLSGCIAWHYIVCKKW